MGNTIVRSVASPCGARWVPVTLVGTWAILKSRFVRVILASSHSCSKVTLICDVVGCAQCTRYDLEQYIDHVSNFHPAIQFINSGTRELTLKCTHWALALVKGNREPHEAKKKYFDLGGNRTHIIMYHSYVSFICIQFICIQFIAWVSGFSFSRTRRRKQPAKKSLTQGS